MIEMEVQRVQVSSHAYHRVVLRAKEGDGNLHIVIGPAEARAISMAHRGQKPPRPLSYDMARALLEEAGARIEQVAIVDLQDGIYYAEIRLLDENGHQRVVDSRPSDAIALALRTDAPSPCWRTGRTTGMKRSDRPRSRLCSASMQRRRPGL